MRARHVFLIALAGAPSAMERSQLRLEDRVEGPGEGTLWLSGGDPAAVAAELRAGINAGRVRSAALLPGIPHAEQRWLATEWRGALVVDRGLAGLLGPELHAWVEAGSYPEQHMVVLRPLETAEPAADATAAWVEGPDAYQDALRAAQPVVARARVGDVLERLGDWFGALADPAVGGAMALLMLSGATRPSDEIVLRNPAALGLAFDEDPQSLGAYVRAGRVRATGWGTTRHAEARHALDRRARSVAWEAELTRLARARSQSEYAVLLELSAVVDPEVVVGEGLVVEQTDLTGAQTLAVAEPRRVRVDLGEIVPVALPAWCLNANLPAPAGEPVRPTPLRFPTPPGVSQRQVWAQLDERLRRTAG